MKNRFRHLNEGIYSFYEKLKGKTLSDKIMDYYLDKIRMYGNDSLTDVEKKIFKEAQNDNLTMDKVSYARDKTTGDIDYSKKIEDPNKIFPGVPFLTAKGRGEKIKNVVNARCYWDDQNPSCKYYYVFNDSKISQDNQYGLIIYKTESKDGKPLGSFIVPKSESSKSPNELWEMLENKYDRGFILDQEILNLFLKFDDLYHRAKKENLTFLQESYQRLKNYRGK